jgi:hypothetical protein
MGCKGKVKMNYFHNNIRIRKCIDCPFCGKETRTIEGNDFEELYCVPIKHKYGCNPIDEKSKPGSSYCRLTNEVTEEHRMDNGAFWGKSIAEIREVAPKYIKALVDRGVFRIVKRFPDI